MNDLKLYKLPTIVNTYSYQSLGTSDSLSFTVQTKSLNDRAIVNSIPLPLSGTLYAMVLKQKVNKLVDATINKKTVCVELYVSLIRRYSFTLVTLVSI